MNVLIFFGVGFVLMGVWQLAWSNKWSVTVGPIWKSLGLEHMVHTPEYWKKVSRISGGLFLIAGVVLLAIAGVLALGSQAAK